MPSLREQLSQDPTKREAVIQDALEVLDQEVADKSGIQGIAIKTAFKMVKGIKPGFIREVVAALLDDFVDALDPVYQDAIAKGEKPGTFLETQKSRVADDLLSITDKRAERSKNKIIKGGYNKLRGTAKKHVEAAAPRLGRLLDRHAAGPE